MPRLAARTDYSRAERRSDAAVHLAGLAAVAVAVPALLLVAGLRGGGGLMMTACAIYGATLALMILFSALYNSFGPLRWRGWLRRLDHSAIYAKIAGTYTPLTLIPGGHGAALLAGIWGAALAGVGLKILAPGRGQWLGLALYLGMGWAGLLLGGHFLATLSTPVIVLMLVGGGIYTAGVAFFLSERLPFHYTIWHGFVLVASLVFYAAITLHVVHVTA